MSVHYEAIALIGIVVPPKMFEGETRIVPAFPHNHPRTMKFDPETGRKLWQTEILPHPLYDPDGKPNNDSYSGTFAGFEIVTAADVPGTWLAIKIVRSEKDMTSIDFEDLARKKQELKAALSKIGAWNEKDFGLYAIQYIAV